MKSMISNGRRASAILLIIMMAAPCANAENLCGRTEEIVFSCGFENKKSVAVCKGNDDKEEYLEYRYGQRKKIELRFRADKSDAEKKFHRAEVIYSSNASEIIWFQHNDVYYQIHLPMRGGPILEALQDGRTIAHQNCTGGWRGAESNLGKARTFVVDHGSGSVGVMSPLWGEK